MRVLNQYWQSTPESANPELPGSLGANTAFLCPSNKRGCTAVTPAGHYPIATEPSGGGISIQVLPGAMRIVMPRSSFNTIGALRSAFDQVP